MTPRNHGIKRTRRCRTEDARSVDRVLISEGLDSATEWFNGNVRFEYGACSKQSHMLSVLTQNYAWGQSWMWEWNQVAPDAQSCRHFDSFTQKPYAKTLHGRCTTCKRRIQSRIVCSRIVAIFQLPIDQLWKAVVTRRRFAKKYTFEGSAHLRPPQPLHHRLSRQAGDVQAQCRTQAPPRGDQTLRLCGDLHWSSTMSADALVC